MKSVMRVTLMLLAIQACTSIVWSQAPAAAKVRKPQMSDTIKANIYADNTFMLYIKAAKGTGSPETTEKRNEPTKQTNPDSVPGAWLTVFRRRSCRGQAEHYLYAVRRSKLEWPVGSNAPRCACIQRRNFLHA